MSISTRLWLWIVKIFYFFKEYHANKQHKPYNHAVCQQQGIPPKAARSDRLCSRYILKKNPLIAELLH
jgi:hypothetical protein